MDSSFKGGGNKGSALKQGSNRGCFKAVEWSFREGYTDYARAGRPIQCCDILATSLCTYVVLLAQTLRSRINELWVRVFYLSLPGLPHTVTIIISFKFWLLLVFVVARGLSCPAACGLLIPRPGTEPVSPTLNPFFKKNIYLGEGNGNSLQYSCLGNPMDRGDWNSTNTRLRRVGYD